MPLEHHEPVCCVTFSLDAESQISASRANFRRQILGRRTLTRLAIFFAAAVGAGLVVDRVWGGAEPYGWAMILGAEVLLIIPLLFLGLYAVIPSRVRRLVRQNPLLNRPIEACWSTVGLTMRAANGTSELAWRDYYGWYPAAVGFLLHVNDQHYHLIPAAALLERQQDALRAILEASRLKRL